MPWNGFAAVLFNIFRFPSNFNRTVWTRNEKISAFNLSSKCVAFPHTFSVYPVSPVRYKMCVALGWIADKFLPLPNAYAQFVP